MNPMIPLNQWLSLAGHVVLIKAHFWSLISQLAYVACLPKQTKSRKVYLLLAISEISNLSVNKYKTCYDRTLLSKYCNIERQSVILKEHKL
jgi:hypothetical protein